MNDDVKRTTPDPNQTGVVMNRSEEIEYVSLLAVTEKRPDPSQSGRDEEAVEQTTGTTESPPLEPPVEPPAASKRRREAALSSPMREASGGEPV